MNLVSTAITVVGTLLGVVLGGWLSIRNQERSWHRDHARQWRDIRLSAYNDFLSAFRHYIAFTLEPTAKIVNNPRPELPGEPMLVLDKDGRPYKEKLDSTLMAARLVSEKTETVQAIDVLVLNARKVAAARAEHLADDIPTEIFNELWAAQRTFVNAARQELGLAASTSHLINP